MGDGADTAPGALSSCLYRGEVMHVRLLPFRHRFVYRVFSMLIDLDQLDTLSAKLRFFSRNRFNLFAYFDRDHGSRDGTPVGDWVRSQLRDAGYDSHEGRITTHCFPRIFGFVFNPLTIYFCYHPDGHLQAVLYEVKNTFGQQHCYLIPVDGGHDPACPVRQTCEKDFYVSPFMDMQSSYRFRLNEPGEKLSILIRQKTPEGETLVATHTGRREPLSDRTIVKMAVLYPLLTVKVVAGIHWEALKLWIKGAVFHARPAEPETSVTVVGKSSTGRHAA